MNKYTISPTTNTILMVRPACFNFNQQTAVDNAFQKMGTLSAAEIHQHALDEFSDAVKALQQEKINIFVIDDTIHPQKPDAVFPNNWVSFHSDGTVVLYPMFAQNRRLERRVDILEKLQQQYKFSIKRVIDLSHYEQQDKFLEGTGSLVIDHPNRIAYACLSERTHSSLLEVFSKEMQIETLAFVAVDNDNKPIYHTNVVMTMGDKFAILCADVIRDKKQRQSIIKKLEDTGHEVIFISLDQLKNFAGNMLLVHNDQGKKILVMSQQAMSVLDTLQKQILQKYCRLLAIAIPTIERYGGGSMRCMMAEVFLPKQQDSL